MIIKMWKGCVIEGCGAWIWYDGNGEWQHCVWNNEVIVLTERELE